MPYADPELARLIVTLTKEEREAFDRWANWGGKPRLSMTVAAREMIRMAVSNKVPIDREKAHRDFARKPGVKAKAGPKETGKRK